ncbi:2'-5' RNA ligase family protein [Deinococcus ruber]|uniref:2'-5' RNA ligase n=1 Tax=Deinococcus ruber TaxID=1848197 RepID=A0A918F297_9DEIO|nr:2'-5' RNA ligase family protein [Deinococcus ruber]GGQ94815.1 hypothetical protein GCM10008957_03800 [Deinococcus ruber]
MTAAPTTMFIGVLPPDPLVVRVRQWQAALNHVITTPHITLKAPGQWSAAQLAACRSSVATCAPFTAELSGAATFGERVIFLKAGGDGLASVHAALVAALGEGPGTFELGGYHPHLTLALSWRPLHGTWQDALASAQAEFADLEAAPLRFTVGQVALFEKQRAGQPYRVAELWALA